MIVSFRCKETQRIFEGRRSRKLPPELLRKAETKLKLLHAATLLETLRVPPGNRLEALSGGREGQFSIRINEQWRICFRWEGSDAFDVEIVDYHKG
ncbi:MAG: type II toxin-antitoxin system RelE/ParE family toxin [Deferrisomatales bacterium]|nr:type II toxin-antitoxin system RelE/ParE family toxin [Deferrisomatales bacterium]